MNNGQPTSLTRRLVRAGGWRLAKRLMKSVPFAGSAVALGLAGTEVRRKGLVRGVAHVGLDLIPFIGTTKNIVEIFTGDLIPDKPTASQSAKPYRAFRQR